MYVVEYYAALKRNVVLLRAPTLRTLCRVKEARHKGHIRYDPPLYEMSRTEKSIETESSLRLLEVGGGRNGEWSLNGGRLPFWSDENVWSPDRGGGWKMW